jgi:ribosome-binding protein aMBF1 (putative translation factor)
MDHQDFQTIGWNKPQPVCALSMPILKRKPIETDDPPPPAKMNHSVKSLIQKARLARGLSQKQLANKLNITAKTINSYESGSAIPDYQLLRKISNELGVKLSLK